MALQTQGFVTPEQDFRGLYKLSGTLEEQRLRNEKTQQQAQAKRATSDKYFTNYLDPNDRFTGTKFDPEIHGMLATALKQAYDLSSKGADDTEIFTAISPIVNKVNEYSQKAQAINLQKKQAMELLKGQKGIDMQKFANEFDDAVFYQQGQNGAKSLRDLSLIDTNQNYADTVLKDRDVYTNEGFDDFVSKSGKETLLEDVSVYNKDKSMRRTKAEMTKPSFMVSEKDARGAHIGFVPDYDIASDGEQPVLHNFLDETGNATNAPVRLVTQDVFNSLPLNTKSYLRQEARKYAKENNIDFASPQVENFAKALAYDELKRSAKQYSTLKEIQVQKAAPTIIQNRTTVNTGSTAQPVQNGNEFDNIPKGQISKSGVEYIEPNDIPTNMAVALKAYGAANLNADELKYLEIYRGADGSIDYVVPILRTLKDDGEEDESKPLKAGKKITRVEMKNAQLKFNNEPQKGEQLKFGKGASGKITKNNPLGLDL